MSSRRPPHLQAVPDLARTRELQLAAVEVSARVASEHAARCWTTYLEAVERGADATSVERELQGALVQTRYAWAVYHCARSAAAVEDPDG